MAIAAKQPDDRAVSAERMVDWSDGRRQAFLEELTGTEQEQLLYRWDFWARAKQREPLPPWRVWLILAGRGFGKTRTGAEWCRAQVEAGHCRRLALVARTSADVRDVLVEGESGLLRICPPWNRPHYNPSKRRLTWPGGAIATLYSADEPEALRGPEHDGAWCDELASWRYPEAWDMLMFGLRLGDDPRVVVTTTPKPTKLVRDLMASPHTVVTRGSSYENRGNLAPIFYDEVVRKYEGTRLGRQELLAEILDDNPDALWQRRLIDENRVSLKDVPPLHRVAVAVDPSIHDGVVKDDKERQRRQLSDDRAACGIVAGGIAKVKGKTHLFVMEDQTTFDSPGNWAKIAVRCHHRLKGDRVIAEQNQGGEMVRLTLQTADKHVPVTLVSASRGKLVRAEPVAALYERGLVHHVGSLPDLEDELCDWVPGERSPNRLDALVWLATGLVLKGQGRQIRGY